MSMGLGAIPTILPAGTLNETSSRSRRSPNALHRPRASTTTLPRRGPIGMLM